MKYVSFENALEVQVGGHFYSFAVGNYHVEDELADIIVVNYHNRGARFGTLPSEGGPEPLPLPEPEAEAGESEPVAEPDADAIVPDKSSTRRARSRTS
jgi:hypothetical protein